MDSFIDGVTGVVWACLPGARGTPPVDDGYWLVATDVQVQQLWEDFGHDPHLLLTQWGSLTSVGSAFYTRTGVGHVWTWGDFALSTGEPTSPAWVATAFVHPVPEPTTLVLLIVGLGVVALRRWLKGW